MDQFQWDVEFDPGEFKTVIPPDYEPLEIQMEEGGAPVRVQSRVRDPTAACSWSRPGHASRVPEHDHMQPKVLDAKFR